MVSLVASCTLPQLSQPSPAFDDNAWQTSTSEEAHRDDIDMDCQEDLCPQAPVPPRPTEPAEGLKSGPAVDTLAAADSAPYLSLHPSKTVQMTTSDDDDVVNDELRTIACSTKGPKDVDAPSAQTAIPIVQTGECDSSKDAGECDSSKDAGECDPSKDAGECDSSKDAGECDSSKDTREGDSSEDTGGGDSSKDTREGDSSKDMTDASGPAVETLAAADSAPYIGLQPSKTVQMMTSDDDDVDDELKTPKDPKDVDAPSVQTAVVPFTQTGECEPSNMTDASPSQTGEYDSSKHIGECDSSKDRTDTSSTDTPTTHMSTIPDIPDASIISTSHTNTEDVEMEVEIEASPEVEASTSRSPSRGNFAFHYLRSMKASPEKPYFLRSEDKLYFRHIAHVLTYESQSCGAPLSSLKKGVKEGLKKAGFNDFNYGVLNQVLEQAVADRRLVKYHGNFKLKPSFVNVWLQNDDGPNGKLRKEAKQPKASAKTIATLKPMAVSNAKVTPKKVTAVGSRTQGGSKGPTATMMTTPMIGGAKMVAPSAPVKAKMATAKQARLKKSSPKKRKSCVQKVCASRARRHSRPVHATRFASQWSMLRPLASISA